MITEGGERWLQNWHRTAYSRLRFEVAGLAFALKHGYSPENYARHLWGKGAETWMGGSRPAANAYLRKEAEAFALFYPKVSFTFGPSTEDQAELIFTQGCLAGWGEDRWSMARGWGLSRGMVCRYCRESFRVWGEQLHLIVQTYPHDDICTLKASMAGSYTLENSRKYAAKMNE